MTEPSNPIPTEAIGSFVGSGGGADRVSHLVYVLGS